MPKKLELAKGAALVSKIHSLLLTSYHMVDRIKHPQYIGKTDVPEALAQFKLKLTTYREKTSALIIRLNESDGFKRGLYKYQNCDDLSEGSPYHGLLLELVLASFGIGECGECASRLMVELSCTGYSDFAKVAVFFPSSPHGAEKLHSFVIANLSKPPSFPAGLKVILPMLLTSLPEEALILDPFLELCFKPNQMPEKFHQYLKAYGEVTELQFFHHFYNVSKTLFKPYLLLAEEIKAILISENALASLEGLPLKVEKSGTIQVKSSEKDSVDTKVSYS